MVAAYNGSQEQALKGSGKKKGGVAKLYFSNQQNANLSGGTVSIGDMETVDTQGNPINNGGGDAMNGGRASLLAPTAGP